MKRPFKFSSPGFNISLDKVQQDPHIQPGSHDDFQRFWYCPKDKTELKIVPNPISINAYYKIEKRVIEETIMDGIASKRFPSDLFFSVKLLAEHMFSTTELSEVLLANTYCPTCRLSICSPKL
jgi:hypothetical protein